MLPSRYLLLVERCVRLVSVLLLTIAIVQVLTPPSVSAQSSQSANNTAVFSGQFIPAFVGSAYDPSAAYQRMAGLPVYVYAYDSWGGSSFIINNLAVRTQVRADGSFQAQGLPNGQKFGVYFPFRYDVGSGRVLRTDCVSFVVAPCDATAIQGLDVPFRMPQLPSTTNPDPDRIGSVFSYNIGDASNLTAIYTQLQEEVRLGLSFLTQETRVDIANNINTFPLIPTTTLKITSKHVQMYGGVNFSDDSAYELVARRVWFDYINAGSRDLYPGDNLIVAGRTTHPLEAITNTADHTRNDRIFMAFAPPGVYAVTIWRREGGTTYQSDLMDNNTKIKSTQIGFGVVRVSRDTDINGTVDLGNDWYKLVEPTAIRNDIALLQNKLILWGRVIQQSGRAFAGPNLGNVSMVNTQSYGMVDGGRLGTQCDNRQPFTYPRVSLTVLGNCATDIVTTSGTNPQDYTQNSFSTYIFYDDTVGYSTNPRGATFDPFLNEPLWDKTPIKTKEVISTNGPLQVDITATAPKSDPTVKGILIEVIKNTSVPAGLNAQRNCRSYNATVSLADPNEIRNIDADNIEKFSADSKCFIHIPHDKLVPIEGITGGLIDPPLSLRIMIDGTGLNPKEIITPYNGSALVEFTGANAVTLSQYTPPVPSGYKLLGFIPVRTIMPGVDRAYAATPTVADIIVRFKGASSYQTATVHNSLGEHLYNVSEDQLRDKSGEWSLIFPLEMRDPDTACPTGSFVSPELCRRNVEASNTYTISVTADDKVLSETFVTRPDVEQGVAVGTPNTWTADFRPPCQILEERLEAEHQAELQRNLVPAGWTEPEKHMYNVGIRIGFVFKGFEAVRIPVLGCRIANGFTELAGKGLQTLRNILILEPLTVSTGVIVTWNIIRGVANIIFVFLLLLIGINHALGYDIKSWGANVMLPQLVIGIIFANLSVLIVQGVLDVNNILTAWIFAIIFDVLQTTGISTNAIAGAGAAGGIVAITSFLSTVISTGVATFLTSVVGTGGSIIIPIIGAVLAGALAILGLVVSLLAVFLGRYLIIWVITIVAPLFLALSVLPWFRSMRNLWIKTLLPLAFMQTITALFIAIGILLVSKTAEADSLFVQAGVFLIGGGTLFMSTKSASLAAQFLGGGGLAGQALGMLQGIGKGLGGKVQNMASGVSDYTSLDAVEERREKGYIRSATQRGRETRLKREAEERGETYVRPLVERLPFAGSRIAEAKEKRERKFDASLKKAEAAGIKAGTDLDYNLPTTDAPLLKRLYGGQQYAAAEQQLRKKVLPSVDIVGRTGLGAQQQKAIHTGLDLSINDPNRIINFGKLPQYSGGKLARWSKREVDSGIAPAGTKAGAVKLSTSEFRGTHAQYLAELGRRSGNASLGSVKSASELKKAPGDAHGIYMEAMALALKQNPADVQGALPPLPGQRDRRDIQGLKKLYQEGARYNRDFAATPTPAAPSGGGGGTGGGGGRTP